MVGLAEFLAAHDRWPEATEWVDRALLLAPNETAALRLRAGIRKARLPVRQAGNAARSAGRPLQSAVRWSTALIRRAVGKD
jgi:hypothetical protein